MSLGVWGSSGWTFMHYITFAYPAYPTVADKQHYRQFFESIPHILPCPKCRKHFEENLKKHPLMPALKSRNTLIAWLVTMHNEVNKAKGKPQWSVQRAMKHYSELSANEESNEWFKIIVIGGGVGALLYLLAKKLRR